MVPSDERFCASTLIMYHFLTICGVLLRRVEFIAK